MTAVDELVAFVRAARAAHAARLDEDERVALAASPGPWRPSTEHDEVLAVDDITVADGFALSGNQLRATVVHIARWDPASVLERVEQDRRDIEAKRRILDRYEDALARQTDPDESQLAADIQVREYEDWIIPDIAQPYAGQPGWREEWRA